MYINNKRQLGQFYTISNPFHHPLFYSWLENIPPDLYESPWLEPFAGSNNIPELIDALEIRPATSESWTAYDIQQPEENTSEIPVNIQDTISDFPKGYKVAITNPPYLAKNSAKRRGLVYPDTAYDDLYKLCLKRCLDNVDYLAAIIPQSFVTAKDELLKKRLFGILTLNIQMFEDTECPVCLALFQKETSSDFLISDTSTLHSTPFNQFLNYKLEPTLNAEINFNSPQGLLGLKAVDDTSEPSIRFCIGSTYPSSSIKQSSRSYTRIASSLFENIESIDSFIQDLNLYLNDWRNNTNDIFLTSFKGLRRDGEYRRRLDWSTASLIIRTVYEQKYL